MIERTLVLVKPDGVNQLFLTRKVGKRNNLISLSCHVLNGNKVTVKTIQGGEATRALL
ncbi:MAG: nucleoside diphosphate kinase [Patescibacteria group bacterium]|jgi:nucleoside diphosphate kinase